MVCPLVDPTYIPPEGFERLMSYKYKGTDQSLIYKHILTPMNQVRAFSMKLARALNLSHSFHTHKPPNTVIPPLIFF